MKQNADNKLWTELQKRRLLFFVEHNKLETLVKWTRYKNDVPGKSAKQAKSYYNNILKFGRCDTDRLEEQELQEYMYQFTLKGLSAEQLRQHFSYKSDGQFAAMRERLQQIQIKFVQVAQHLLKSSNAGVEFDRSTLNLIY